MEDYNLDPIFEYQMNELEANAYKVGLMWMEMFAKVFPNHRNLSRYPQKNDPRKSSLFRYVYTLIQKTKSILDPKDYKLYITAQLQMLKSISINNLHPQISPNCLLGDKAWTRWKVWKTKFDNTNKSTKTKDIGLDKGKFEEAKTSLSRTKTFLNSKFEHKEEVFKTKSKDVERWISTNQVCGFYAVMSPWVAKYCNLSDIDLDYYKSSDVNIINYFNELFKEDTL